MGLSEDIWSGRIRGTTTRPMPTTERKRMANQAMQPQSKRPSLREQLLHLQQRVEQLEERQATTDMRLAGLESFTGVAEVDAPGQSL